MRALGFLSSAVLVLVAWTGAHAQTGGGDIPSVVVTKVESRVVQAGDGYVARVEAITTVDLQARVTGFLEQRNFTEGDFVRKGDLLYQIEKASYVASVAQYQAAVEGAEATQKNAELYLERQRILLRQGDVPQATVDEAVATLGADRAATDVARAELQAAQIDLGYTDIYSPIDGRIGISAVDVGNVVSSTTGVLATITSVDPIYVVFYISEKKLLEERRQGLITGSGSTLTARVTLADGEAYPQAGTVVYVDTEIQKSTDTILLRASFPNPDSVLIPGQFVTIDLENPDTRPVITVPQTALQLDREGHFVFIVDADDTIERRNVTLGRQISGAWEVDRGLSDGELVVIQGLQKVHQGGKVNPVVDEGSDKG